MSLGQPGPAISSSHSALPAQHELGCGQSLAASAQVCFDAGGAEGKALQWEGDWGGCRLGGGVFLFLPSLRQQPKACLEFSMCPGRPQIHDSLPTSAP